MVGPNDTGAAPLIGQAHAKTINVSVKRVGYGLGAILSIVAVTVGISIFSATAALTIDIPAALERMALATSAEVDKFRSQLTQAQVELDTLRREHPEWSQ